MAIEQHVNAQLQSAVAAANDVAEAQARAVVGAHTIQHAHNADVRMTETFQRLHDQLHASMEQRIQDVLKAHAEQVSVEIRLAIAAQGQEILKAVKEQIKAVKKDNTTQVEQAKSTAEKEAKSIVRRHYAQENAAHEILETMLLQTKKEFKKTAVATALLHVDERLRSFLIQQMAKGRDVKSQGAGQYAIKEDHEQRSCGEANTMDLNTSSMATSTNASSV
ncbi:hypothetical protein PPTG_07247 [Phytophthora nicotianae INRA-310]|uniref:Uncharacterized protein n=1 Tax=Phytophthora nicotianae (strain INRA-310) TaxID=761204 RepID=W2QR99_PHYN3|nr:hypothetical protein PPTG_07247 [Phytophthora nicotianae INRA-310]ETN15029.1 hypothetical protein PPTG_07247 [Phytophthora nicotianae INRA-310]